MVLPQRLLRKNEAVTSCSFILNISILGPLSIFLNIGGLALRNYLSV